MATNNLNLDGGEISIIKALGLSGSEITGEQLASRVSDMGVAELINSLNGLIMMGYVISDTSAIRKEADFQRARFQVNSGYARELKDAMDPTPDRPKSRRMRRE